MNHLYGAAIDCPHTIDSNSVTLHFDPKQPGHNALNQLSQRLESATQLAAASTAPTCTRVAVGWHDETQGAIGTVPRCVELERERDTARALLSQEYARLRPALDYLQQHHEQFDATAGQRFTSLIGEWFPKLAEQAKHAPKRIVAAAGQYTDFLAGVVGVVGATSYETHCLWLEYHKERKLPWDQGLSGYLPTIGTVAGRPICLSLFVNTINGHKILFVEATSQLVDHVMIEQWLKENLPATAMKTDGQYVNMVSASNFHNVLPQAEVCAAPAPIQLYSYAESANAERWHGQFDSIPAAIAEALGEYGKDPDRVVYIGENEPFEPNYGSLAEEVVERLGEQAYEEVGEVADTIGPFTDEEMKPLVNAIKAWTDQHADLTCWTAENIKAYRPGDAEYEQARALLAQKENVNV